MIPESLSAELEQVIAAYRHARSGEPMGLGTAGGYRDALSKLYAETARVYPERRLEGLRDFKPEDFRDLRRSLDLRQAAGEIKTRTIRAVLMNLKGLFKAAQVQGVTSENVATGVKAPVPARQDEYRRLTVEERDGLMAVDEKRLASLDDKGKFLYLRDKAMLAVHFDAALRASEVARLSEKDILWVRQTAGGIVPIVIRESKDRPAGFEDLAYLSPLGVGYLKRYLVARDRYLGQAGVEPERVYTRKSHQLVGKAVFCNEKGRSLTANDYRAQVYAPMAEEAGLPSEYSGRTHYLRHTRISEWVESGMDAKRVQKLARHMHIEETLAYYTFKEKDLLEDYGRRFGAGGEKAPAATQAWPEKAVRLELFRHALKLNGLEPDEAHLERLDAALQVNSRSKAAKDLFYTVAETCGKLGIKRTQLYMGWIKAGHLHPLKVGSRTAFLKNEVDALAAYLTAEEASVVLGYREKTPSMISRLAAQGVLPSVEMGKGRRFKAQDLARFLIDKKDGRTRLNFRQIPRLTCSVASQSSVRSLGNPSA